jgi:ParB family chromosome partitioning protein
MRYDPAEVAQAGIFVSIDGNGELFVERGFVRPEDERPATTDAQERPDDASKSIPATERRAVISVGGGTEAEPEEAEDSVKPLPDRLLTELTAFRTLALRDALANNPQVALTALLHTLCGELFSHIPTGCLQVFVRHVSFPVQAADLKDSEPARAIAARQTSWAAQVPGDDDALWDWVGSLDDASRMALLAHCVSHGVNALYDKADRHGGSGLERRIAHADRLAHAVSLDAVAAGRRPTVESYLGRVPKARILEAVREAKGDDAVGADRTPEEGRHGQGSRTAAARWHRLAAGAAPHRQRGCFIC